MASDADPAIKRLAKLVKKVFELHDVVQRNRLDGELFSKGYEFVYLIDPDLLELYAYPGDPSWMPVIAALPWLQQSDEADEDALSDAEVVRPEVYQAQPYLAATSLLTGEYIFSPRLVRNQNRLYVGPEHMTEFLHFVDRIERRFTAALRNRQLENPAVYDALQRKLADAKRQRELEVITEKRFVESVHNILLHDLADISHDALLARARLDHLLSQNILANAQSNVEFTRSVLAPKFATVDWFSKRIAQAKIRHTHGPSREALEADAVTLAQLVELNKDWEKNRKVFVLITRDQGLAYAYGDWIEDCLNRDSRDRNCFYALRQPRQYVPVLNMRDMGGSFTEKRVFNTVERATSTIVDLFGQEDNTKYKWQPEGTRKVSQEMLERVLSQRIDSTDDFAAVMDQQIDDISTCWTDLLKIAVMAKSDIIAELTILESEFWQKFIGTTIKRPINTLVDSFDRQFENFTASSAMLRREIWAVEIKGDAARREQRAENDYGRRQIASNFRDFSSEAFKGKSVEEVLLLLPPEVDAAVDILSKANREERLLVTAAVCLDVGAWAAASTLLARARQNQPIARLITTPLGREIQFFSCVTDRLSAIARNWERKYKSASACLKKLLDASADSPFERVRILSELLALHLSALVWDIDPRFPAAGRAPQYYRDAVQALRDLKAEASRQRSGEWKSVDRQIELNTLCIYFWGNVLGLEESNTFRHDVQAIVARLDSHSEPERSPHQRNYPDMARLFLDDTNTIAVKDALVERLQRAISQEQRDNFAFEMPMIDKYEFQKMLIFLHADSRRGLRTDGDETLTGLS